MGSLTGPAEIEGLLVQLLREIADDRGAVLHMLRSDSPLFRKFGEIYFSEVFPGGIKAWKRHRVMTQHFAVPVGRIRVIAYDDRTGSRTRGALAEYDVASRETLGSASVAAFFYALAGSVIVGIVLAQSQAHPPNASWVG